MSAQNIKKSCLDQDSKSSEKVVENNRPFFIGIPQRFPVPKFQEQPTGVTLPIVLTFNYEDAPYIAHNDVTQRSVGNFLYDPAIMNLSQIVVLVSRSINPGNPNSVGHVRLIRSDNLFEVAQINFTNEDLHTEATNIFVNLPTQPTILELVVFVDNPATNVQIHSALFYV